MQVIFFDRFLSLAVVESEESKWSFEWETSDIDFEDEPLNEKELGREIDGWFYRAYCYTGGFKTGPVRPFEDEKRAAFDALVSYLKNIGL